MFKLLNFIGRFAGLDIEQIVTRDRAIIRVSGFNTRWLLNDIEHLYGTSRTTTYLFTKTTGYYVEFHSFFALEFDKCLTDLQDPANRRSSAWIAKRIQDMLRAKTWLSNLTAPASDIPRRIDLSQLKKFVYTPLDYQQQLLDEYDEKTWRLRLNGILLDAVMGSGKTMMYLYVGECLNADHIVVLCPANAMDRVWNDTIQQKLKYKPTMWRSDKNVPFTGQRYLLIHHDAIEQGIALAGKLKGKHVVIGVDECHRFNEMSSQRTQRLIQFCKAIETRDVVMQSGTMFKAVGSEIIAAMYCLDMTFNEKMEESFKRLYSASARGALQLLQYRLGYITYKVVAEQVKLGEPITDIKEVTTPDGQDYTLTNVLKRMKEFVEVRKKYYESRQARDYELYKKLIDRFKLTISGREEQLKFEEYQRCITVIKRGDLMACRDEIVWANRYENTVISPRLDKEQVKDFREVKTIYKYVSLKIQGECLGQVVGRMREQVSVSIAGSLKYHEYIESTSKKSLFYTNYVSALKLGMEKVKEEGYKPLAVFGETNKDVNIILKQFEENPEINPVWATFHSLSTAIPLTVADRMFMIDVPWRDYVFQQTVARIHRLGKDSQTYVTIFRLNTGDEPNLSSRTVNVLKWSQSQVELITGTKSPFEIEDTKVSLEAAGLANRPLTDADLNLCLESAFMAKLV